MGFQKKKHSPELEGLVLFLQLQPEMNAVAGRSITVYSGVR